MYHTNHPLILASASPRRKELLEQLGITLIVVPAHIAEVQQSHESGLAMVQRLAREKARAVAKMYPSDFILSADTDVELDGVALGKPKDSAEAEQIVNKLAGRTHSVHTVACLLCTEKNIEEVVSSETRVTFRKLTSQEITAYVRSDHVLDKAGAYGAQGIGLSIIERVEGSFSGVVGLDLALTLDILLRHSVIHVDNLSCTDDVRDSEAHALKR